MNSLVSLTNVCKRCGTHQEVPDSVAFREIGGFTKAVRVHCPGCHELNVCLFFIDMAILHHFQWKYEEGHLS